MADVGDRLARVADMLRDAAVELELARGEQPAVRVLYADGWQPPTAEPVHTCTGECTESDGVGVCVVTDAEVRAAHRTAEKRVEWLRKWWPLAEAVSDGE